MMSEQPNKNPIIYFDFQLMDKYAHILNQLECDFLGIPLNHKCAHFLIPPDFAVYCWDPNGNPKQIYDEIQQFRQFYPKRLIIMEGFPKVENVQLFCGLQMKIWLEGFDSIQPSITAQDTCLILKSIATRLQIRDTPHSLNRAKPSEDIYDRHQNLLEGLIGTGTLKSKLLLENFDSCLKAIYAIKNNPDLILNIRGFGLEFISSNYCLLYQKKPRNSE